jgi:hypothetical protein
MDQGEMNNLHSKIARFVPIRLQTWPPQAILISDLLIFKILLL